MRVVVVDPNAGAAKLLSLVLGEAGYEVASATNTAAARVAIGAHVTDAVLLDDDPPRIDGCRLCLELRAAGYRGPVIFVSHRSTTVEKLRAFEHGADDYVVEPFDPLELMARLEAVARRCRAASDDAPGTTLRVGEVELVIGALTVRVGQQPPVLLTPTEMRMLEYLMRHAGTTISREQLIANTWGYAFIGESNRVDVYVSRLRKKLERDPSIPTYLHTVRGSGYVFRAQPRPPLVALPLAMTSSRVGTGAEMGMEEMRIDFSEEELESLAH